MYGILYTDERHEVRNMAKAKEKKDVIEGETPEERDARMRRLYPNLKRPSDRTDENWREIRSMGGKACSVLKAKKRTQREILEDLLALEPDDPAIVEKLKALGLEGTNAEAMNLSLVLRAVKSAAVEDLRYIRDTIGEKPVDQSAVSVLDKPLEAIDMTALSDEELAALAEQRA